LGFRRDIAAWGIFDAIRAVHIEEHVVDAIVSLVKDAGLEDEVDLVQSGRTVLFLTEEEEAEAREEYEIAQAAGIDVSVAEWLAQDKVEKVHLCFPRYNRMTITVSAEIRSAISGSAYAWKYDMASQVRH